MRNIEHLENPYGADVWLAEEAIPFFRGYRNDDPGFMPWIPREPRPTDEPGGQWLAISIEDRDKVGIQESHRETIRYLKEHAKAIEEEAIKLLMANSDECRQLVNEGMKDADPALAPFVTWPLHFKDLVNHVDPPSIELGAEPGVIVLRFISSWEEEHGVLLTVFAEEIPRLAIGNHWEDH